MQTAVKPKAQSKEDIYVGKGRFIKDDPAKVGPLVRLSSTIMGPIAQVESDAILPLLGYLQYPDRNIYSGGWAGGEAGLWALREQVKQEKASTSQGKKEAPKRSGNVYIGKGRFINDDARKYADKDSVLVGGFAGGEEGLQMFIEKGDIDLLPEGESRRRVPALLVGFLIATIGGASSVIVNNAGVDITQLEPEDLARFINSFQDNLPTALIPVGIAAAGLVAVRVDGLGSERVPLQKRSLPRLSKRPAGCLHRAAPTGDAWSTRLSVIVVLLSSRRVAP